jgi:hypothetical protein
LILSNSYPTFLLRETPDRKSLLMVVTFYEQVVYRRVPTNDFKGIAQSKAGFEGGRVETLGRGTDSRAGLSSCPHSYAPFPFVELGGASYWPGQGEDGSRAGSEYLFNQ